MRASSAAAVVRHQAGRCATAAACPVSGAACVDILKSSFAREGGLELRRLGEAWRRCLLAGTALLVAVLLCGCAAAVALGLAGTVAATTLAPVAGAAGYTLLFRTGIEDLSELSEADARTVSDLPVIDLPTNLPYVSKGPVKGLACKLSGDSRGWRWWPKLSERNGLTPEAAAMMQVKLKAFRIGGDALLAPTCVNSDGLDAWAQNCFETWVCSAYAVRLDGD